MPRGGFDFDSHTGWRFAAWRAVIPDCARAVRRQSSRTSPLCFGCVARVFDSVAERRRFVFSMRRALFFRIAACGACGYVASRCYFASSAGCRRRFDLHTPRAVIPDRCAPRDAADRRFAQTFSRAKLSVDLRIAVGIRILRPAGRGFSRRLCRAVNSRSTCGSRSVFESFVRRVADFRADYVAR